MSESQPAATGETELLRHTLATLAYRAEKALREPPPGIAEHRIAPSARTALEIVGHLGDLMAWAVELADGRWTWKADSRGEWDADVQRFFEGLAKLDARIRSGETLGHPAPILFQGPIADALTHVGQISMIRGTLGAPVRPESFARAQIRAGRVGPDQSGERREFDGDASAKR